VSRIRSELHPDFSQQGATLEARLAERPAAEADAPRESPPAGRTGSGSRVAAASAERAEHRRRTVAACLLVYLLAQANLGLAWDIRWHGAVGRDDFWTPPHLLIYSGVALAGLLCLAMVLQTSVRRWRGDPSLDEANTVTLFGVFHAPLGFAIAGFGLATLLFAAPFDNYWHELYGIDVALWAPFHLMGLIGGGTAGLGAIYASAAEARRARERGWARWRLLGYSGLDLLTLFAMSGLLSGLLTTAQPAAWQFPTLDLGPLRILTYPLLLALGVGLIGVAAVRLAGRPGTATLVVGLYVVRQVAIAAVVPLLIRTMVAQQGLEYRTPTAEPRFTLAVVVMVVVFLLPALAIDLGALLLGARGLARRRTAALLGAAMAVPLFAVAVGLVYYSMRHARAMGAPPEILIPSLPTASAVWLALPLALLLGALGGALGSGLGAILRQNER